MKTFTEFLEESEVKKVGRANPRQLMESNFNRDPLRPIYHDPDCFYSPADGFILYSNVVAPDKDIVKVKGVDYTINEILKEEVESKECLIISVFMSCLDVHLNRMPTDGFLFHEHVDAMVVANQSMREIESQILKGIKKLDYDEMKYGTLNERVRNKVLSPKLCQHYWMVQIADYEVDVISHFGDSGQFFTQGERFSVVRMGSQCELIIPFVHKGIEFKSIVDDKIGWHVEAGIDSLVEIDQKHKFSTCS